jgi:hypothetical protein
MRKSWNVGTERRCIIVCSDLGGELPSDHAEARGSAKWRIAICIIKDNTVGCQAVNIRGLDHTGWVMDFQQRCRQLIRNDE